MAPVPGGPSSVLSTPAGAKRNRPAAMRGPVPSARLSHCVAVYTMMPPTRKMETGITQSIGPMIEVASKATRSFVNYLLDCAIEYRLR